MDKEKEYMLKAIELSKIAKFPYGAVVVRDGKIIGEASSGDGEDYDPTNHAETLAIRRACQNVKSSDLTGATIYSSCEPCFMCFGTIWWANISNIVYGASIKESNCILDTDINIGIEELNQKTGNKITIHSGVLKEEAIIVMQEWNEKQGKTL